MIVLLLFLQKQNLANAIYLFGLGTLRMVASPPANMARSNTCDILCYSLYLIFPVVTLTLLSTNHWLPDGSPCDPNLKHLVYVPTAPTNQSSDAADEVLPVGQLVVKTLPCTCRTEFPVMVYVLAGIDFFIFVLFVWFNPANIANKYVRVGSEKCSQFLYTLALYFFVVTCTALLILEFVFMLMSNHNCGIVMYLWTLCSTIFRFVIVCFCVGKYVDEDDATLAGRHVQL
jgi:hypothetical protein